MPEHVAQRPELRHVVLIFAAVYSIEASGFETLEAINYRLANAGIGMHLSEVERPARDCLRDLQPFY